MRPIPVPLALIMAVYGSGDYDSPLGDCPVEIPDSVQEATGLPGLVALRDLYDVVGESSEGDPEEDVLLTPGVLVLLLHDLVSRVGVTDPVRAVTFMEEPVPSPVTTEGKDRQDAFLLGWLMRHAFPVHNPKRSA